LKKLILSILICLVICLGLYSLPSISLIPSLGFGYLEGSRYYVEKPSSYTGLCADGLEAGITLEADFSGYSCFEAYFGYLFAFKGGITNNSSSRPKLGTIPENWKYTDYKAGFGYVYKYNMYRLAAGLNFAGISNHYFEGKTQTIGNKVTSFGLYLRAGVEPKITEKLSVLAEFHGCLNFTGWIREFDVASQDWINHFEKSKIKLGSAFCKLGLVYKIN